MGRSLLRLIAAAVLAAACSAQPLHSEEEYAREVRQREARINAVLESAIPRIEWDGLSYEDAWRSLEKSIQEIDPTGEGVRLNIGQKDDSQREQPDAHESKANPLHASFLGATWKAPDDLRVFANARDVKGIEVIKYLADLKGMQFKVSGEGSSPGVYFWRGKHFHNEERADLRVSPAVQAVVKSKLLTSVPASGWMNETLGWKGRLLHDADLNPMVAVQWKNRDSRVVIAGPNSEVFRLRQHIDFLEDAAVAYGLVRLNEGERGLLDATTPMSKIQLRNLNIDAPTLGEALEKLRSACRAVPGTHETSLRWPFLKPEINTLGPVRFSLEEGNAADVLFPILFKLGCKIGARPDGRWGITTRQMSDGDYLETRQFAVPPSFFDRPTQKPRTTVQTKNATDAHDLLACCSGVMPRVKGSFAMYSASSNALVVRETAEGFLMIRKALSESWPKIGVFPVPKK